ncbi:hypothetical protein MPSI1_000608 [Malassezia psittaci]|uniref:Non-specific serine/threonine protein kinase n=1 Tax=Malassezia psittaci TaxID=1821823 RepID=A0AAF0JD23_9BASI|nr:hypothetical protein MPSI1_000608 [Malassezia psittaci]
MSTAEAIVAPADTAGGTLDTALDAMRTGAPGHLPITSPTALNYFAAHPRRPQVYFGDYLLLQTLGEGEFGKVKLGVHRTYGEETAIKLIKREKVAAVEDAEAAKISKVEREIQILNELRHPNIVHLYEVIESERYIGIVLEYGAGGELFDYILAHKCLQERDACRLFSQLISGVSYLHRKKIIHRDLKLENLLLDRDRNVIITDFGFANNFAARGNDLMATSCGSPCYAAPELVVQDGMYVGAAVDVWSCGVILYAMLAGYLPFDDDPANPDGDNINLLYKYIMATPLTFPDYIGSEPRSLLLRMLVPDPQNRATLEEVMQHPWLAPYSSLFRFSVKDLERAAMEQQAKKRQAYREQMLKQEKLLEQQLAQPSIPRSQTESISVGSTTPTVDSVLPSSVSLGVMSNSTKASSDDAPSEPSSVLSLANLTQSTAAPVSRPVPSISNRSPLLGTPPHSNESVAVSSASPTPSSKRVPVPDSPAMVQKSPAHSTGDTSLSSPAGSNLDSYKRKAAHESIEQPTKMHAVDEPRAESRPSRSASGTKARVLSNGFGAAELNLSALGSAAKRTVSNISRRSPSNVETASRSSSSSSRRNGRFWPLAQARVEALDKSEDRVQGSRVNHPFSSNANASDVTSEPSGVSAHAQNTDSSLSKPVKERSNSVSTRSILMQSVSANTSVDNSSVPQSKDTEQERGLSQDHSNPSRKSAGMPHAEPALDYTNRHGLAPPLVFNNGVPMIFNTSQPSTAERVTRDSTVSSSSFGQTPVSLTSYLPTRLAEPARPRKSSTASSKTETQEASSVSCAQPIQVSRPPTSSAEHTASSRKPVPAAKSATVETNRAQPDATEPVFDIVSKLTDQSKQEPTSQLQTDDKKTTVDLGAGKSTAGDTDAKNTEQEISEKTVPALFTDAEQNSLTHSDSAGPNSKRASLNIDTSARNKPERPRPLSMQATLPSATIPAAPGRYSLDTNLDRPMPSAQLGTGRNSTSGARPSLEGRASQLGRSAPWWRRLSGSHSAQPNVPSAPPTNPALTSVREESQKKRPTNLRKPAPGIRPESSGATQAPTVSFAQGDRRFSAQLDARPEQDTRRVSVAGDARTVQRPMRMDWDDRRLGVHVGAVDQAALTTRAPEEVMRNLFEALFSMGIEMRRSSDSEFRIECVRVKRPGLLRQLFGRKRDQTDPNTRWSSRLGRQRPTSAAGVPRASFQHDDVDRAMSRMSIGGIPSSSTGLSRLSIDEPFLAPTTPPLYGEGNKDGGHEVRFYVELTRIATLNGLYSVDIRRVKGNVWSYKFLYHALLERVELGGTLPVRR